MGSNRQQDDSGANAGSKRGFAAMSPEKQRQIASMGGKAAHAHGTAHQFTSDEARQAGRKGGEAVSKDRQHMAEIGRKGGEAVSNDRQHMAQIGREGGKHRHARHGMSEDESVDQAAVQEQGGGSRGEKRE